NPAPVSRGARHPLFAGRPGLAAVFALEDAPAETARVDRLPFAQRQRLDADEALRAELVQHAPWAELSERAPRGQSRHEDDEEKNSPARRPFGNLDWLVHFFCGRDWRTAEEACGQDTDFVED